MTGYRIRGYMYLAIVLASTIHAIFVEDKTKFFLGLLLVPMCVMMTKRDGK